MQHMDPAVGLLPELLNGIVHVVTDTLNNINFIITTSLDFTLERHADGFVDPGRGVALKLTQVVQFGVGGLAAVAQEGQELQQILDIIAAVFFVQHFHREFVLPVFDVVHVVDDEFGDDFAFED